MTLFNNANRRICEHENRIDSSRPIHKYSTSYAHNAHELNNIDMRIWHGIEWRRDIFIVCVSERTQTRTHTHTQQLSIRPNFFCVFYQLIRLMFMYMNRLFVFFFFKFAVCLSVGHKFIRHINIETRIAYARCCWRWKRRRGRRPGRHADISVRA